MHRRTFHWLTVVAGMSGSVMLRRSLPAQEAPPNLKDTLNKGLRSRYPSDYQYIDRVVLFVDQKRLSHQLVLAIFDWVRDRKRHKRYLIPYFREALRREAEAQGEQAP